MFESFKSLPAWAQILLAVVAVVIVLGVIAPLIKLLVDIIVGVVIAVAVLGVGYWALVKLGILK